MAVLAIKGGKATRTKKFTSWPKYDEKEINGLEKVVKSGIWGTLGPEVKNIETRFAEYQQCKYGIGITNGTVTLEVILRALEIGYGDEVIIPPYTFFATGSAVLMVGATPVFVDIESNSYNMDPSEIEKAVTPKTKAIIPVHIAGRPCDMDKIMGIANKYKLYVIEDCAHAHGSEWKGKRVGSIGHAGSFSFQCSKNLNSGEGGMLTINDQDIYERCWSIHNCGRDYNSKIWYEHCNIGTNARLSEWQAAILNSQMDRLDDQITKREENAHYLNSRLRNIECIEIMGEDDRVTRNSNHLFIFKFKSEKCKGLSRDVFIKALNAEGVPCSSGYVCLYKQPAFLGKSIKRIVGTNISYEDICLENAEAASYKEGIWLTQNMLLGEKEDMDNVADGILKIHENAKEIL